MPANLPPQYYELEREFKREKNPREKLRLAEELLAMMPKHKGTDKLQAEMKAKISKLKKQIDGAVKSHAVHQAKALDHIEKEGAGQVILIGPPNCGKSSLLETLTHAKPLIADYPYTTREPMTGMMEFETVQIQLIDTPPISSEMYENYLSGLIRNADLVVLVADLAQESMADDINYVLSKLEEKRIILKNEITQKPEDPRFSYKKTIICAHKEYDDEDGSRLKKLTEIFPDFNIVPTSIVDDDSMKRFKKAVFESLCIIRVYTKPIGHEADYKAPIILPIGGTVEDAAVNLHKDFAHKMKYAKVWGQGKFDGQRVQGDFVLNDGDIIEFHM
ncbi:MAG: TGS domain-containing protein [FCB group bacterium]|nr:TGS domain-containing protein [FCB group bacterium]